MNFHSLFVRANNSSVRLGVCARKLRSDQAGYEGQGESDDILDRGPPCKL